MSVEILRRRGTTVQHSTFVGGAGELTVDTDKNTSVLHDGATVGGFVTAAQHLAQTWVPSQVFANTENFFGNVAAGATVVKFLSTPGAGFATLDFNSNGTPDLNFIRKYNSTPFQIEIGGSGGIDVVTDTNSNETSADIRFLTNGIRGSGTQTLLATFRDNGMVDLTGRTTVTPAANTEGLRVTGFSLTGAASNSILSLAGSLATTGSPTLIDLNVTSGSFGGSTKMVDLKLNSATIFSVYYNGIIDVAAGSIFHWLGRATITSPSDGVIRLSNNVQTDFNRLQFGGTSGAFPALGRSANSLELFNADGGAGSNYFSIYNLKATATDFERLNIGFQGGVDATIWTEAGTTGTGVARDLVLGADSTERLRILVSGQVTWGGGVSLLESNGSIVIDNDLLVANVTSGVVTIANVIAADRGLFQLGFFNAAPVAQQDVIPLTNNVTAGGTADQLDDFAGAVYATDATTIRDDIYQLGEKVNQIITALETYGLLTP